MTRDRLREAAKERQAAAYLAAKALREKAKALPPTEAKIGDRNPDTGTTQASFPNGGTTSARLLYSASVANGSVLKASQAPGDRLKLDARSHIEVRRVEPEVVETGKIKILFSRVIDDERVFYVGGDRVTPKQIFSLPSNANVRAATLTNTGIGINKWIASIAWSDTGVTGLEPLTYAANIKPNQIVDLNASRAHSYLEPRGNSFWSSRFVVAQTLSANYFGFSYLYGEPSTSDQSGDAGTPIFTLTSPTVLSGVLTVTTTTIDLFNSSWSANGSASNKGFSFWDDALETLLGGSTWNGYNSVTSPGGFVRNEGEATITHTGNIYLAPGLQRVATANDYEYGLLGGSSGGVGQIRRRQRQQALWETFLCGDQFALVRSRTETIDQHIEDSGSVTITYSDVNESTNTLVMVDRSGDLPDTQINADLQTLLNDRSTDPTFNLIGSTLWEADIYNYNNAANSDFFNTIKQSNTSLSVNKYNLNGDIATPIAQKAKVFKLVNDNSLEIIAASYHP